ncbi:MAG: SDR family NAD(P)-dependent oxidoreductase [Bacteroidales bacterium]|nr:SDR family NAD(P)-dependent oxidoreductase [Bacteroidales bacterium]
MSRIVIIGASSGLGRAVAEAFARKGWQVGVAARREEPLIELSRAFPGQIMYALIDSSAPEAPDRLSELIDRLGGMDIFLQAAGVGSQNTQLADDIERKTVMTNCTGFTAMVDTAFRYFSTATSPRRGLIAAITSVAATKGLGVAPSYSTSKAYQTVYLTALEQLAHIRRLKIDFCDIRPGFIATDLLDPTDSYPMLMQKDYAVPKIVRAIESRRRVAIIDRRWWLLVKGWRLIPRWLWVRINATTRRSQD